MEHLSALQAAWLALNAIRPHGTRGERLDWRADRGNKMHAFAVLMGAREHEAVQDIRDVCAAVELFGMAASAAAVCI